MTEPRRDDPLTRSYERPLQAWTCGWASEGHDCPLGPTAHGHCRASFECVPRREGDRWHCARSASRGGPCGQGPRPDGTCSHAIPRCQPVRSLRLRRGLVAFFSVALSLGFLLWQSDENRRMNFFSPGELTFQHGSATKSCEECHALSQNPSPAAPRTTVAWNAALAQNLLCRNCHELGENGAHAHGLPRAQQEVLKRAAQAKAASSAPLLLASAKRTLGVPRLPDGVQACGTCHQEHHGQHFNLAFMNNDRCQACHVRQFASLAQGHPEFADYPFHSRPPIFFDHASHIGRHFKDLQRTMPGRTAPKSCVDCHQLHEGGRMMLVKDFAQTCASCHLPQITDVSLGGVRFLNVPAVDVQTLRSQEKLASWVGPMTALSALPRQGPSLSLALAALFRDERLVVQPPFSVGDWPDTAEGPLTPFMQLLLSVDREYAAAQDTLRGLNVRDLRGASPQQLKAAAALVWGVKGLFFDIIDKGDPALAARIRQVIGPTLGTGPSMLLTGNIPPGALAEAQRRWFPSLRTEVPAYRAGLPLKAAVKPATVATPAPPFLPIDILWRRDDVDCSFQYLPRYHTDLFLHAWLDVLGRHYEGGGSRIFSPLFDTLASPYAPGICTQCHGVKAGAGGSRQLEWFSARPQSHHHPFTIFAHEPHWSLVPEKECATCHALQRDSRFQASFILSDHSVNADPVKFESDFAPMSKSICSQCHTAGKAGDSCLFCHNYHVGVFSPFKTPVLPLDRIPLRSGKFHSLKSQKSPGSADQAQSAEATANATCAYACLGTLGQKTPGRPGSAVTAFGSNLPDGTARARVLGQWSLREALLALPAGWRFEAAHEDAARR